MKWRDMLNMIKEKGVRVRAVAFALAAAMIMLGTAVINRVEAERYRRELAAGYQRAMLGLAENIGSIDIELKKSLCAGSAGQFSLLAAQMWGQAAQAKVLLGQLPVPPGKLEKVNLFFAQVGEYAMSVDDQYFADEHYAQLEALSNCASRLQVAVEEVVARLDDGGGWSRETARMTERLELIANVAADAGAGSGFDGTDDALAEYPVLIYDGPFSDDMMERRPLLTEGMENITMEDARGIAHRLSGNGGLKFVGEEISNMPSYSFSGKNFEVSITKAGGIPAYMINWRKTGTHHLSSSEAASRALRFLVMLGLPDMEAQSYDLRGDRCTMNFAYMEDGITIYPDQIKITVALDNGEIIGYDARDYIMNHTARQLPAAGKSAQEAEAAISPRLNIESCKLVLIPSGGLNEILCYEFMCADMTGNQAMVYINATTLKEEKILLCVKTPSGVKFC